MTSDQGSLGDKFKSGASLCETLLDFRLLILAASIITAFLNGCSSSHPSTGSGEANIVSLQQALQHYSDLILHMDNDGIADLFTEQGEIINSGQPKIQGRESIRKFLGSFTEYKVVEESLQADSTAILGTRAIQIAHYHQKVTIPNGKTVDTSGGIKIDWVSEDGRWLIIRVENLPGK